MSVAPLSGRPPPAPPPTAAATGPAARTPSGDYKTANPRSVQTPDNDGDYKPANSAVAQSSAKVQASLASLKVGG